jgi:hypothetical protein
MPGSSRCSGKSLPLAFCALGFAWMLPSPDSQVATDFRPQQPFLIRFDLIFVSYWRNLQNEKNLENEVILKGSFSIVTSVRTK